MDRSPSGGVTGCIVSKFSSVVCNKFSTGISPQSQSRHATHHPPAPAIPRSALGLRRPKIRKRSPCVSWRDLKNRAARRRGRGRPRRCRRGAGRTGGTSEQARWHWMGVAVTRTRRSGTDNDRGTPPHPRWDSKRTTARWAVGGRNRRENAAERDGRDGKRGGIRYLPTDARRLRMPYFRRTRFAAAMPWGVSLPSAISPLRSNATSGDSGTEAPSSIRVASRRASSD